MRRCAQGSDFLNGDKEVLTTIVRPGGLRETRILPLPADTLRWSPPIPLRRAPGFSQARISPDGRWIAYVDEQGGVGEVFVYAGAGGRYQVSVGGGVEPLWSKDGRELFYRTANSLMAARLELGAEARVVRRDTLFSMRLANGGPSPNYDVSADGQSFIVPRPIAVSEWPIVVLGWTEELRARMWDASKPR